MTNEQVLALIKKNPISVGCGLLSLALGAGILARDAAEFIKGLKPERGPRRELLNKVATAVLALAIVGYGVLLLRQNRRYLEQVNSPDSASFEEFATVRGLVGPGSAIANERCGKYGRAASLGEIVGPWRHQHRRRQPP